MFPGISLIKLDFHWWTRKSRALNIVYRTVVNSKRELIANVLEFRVHLHAQSYLVIRIVFRIVRREILVIQRKGKSLHRVY